MFTSTASNQSDDPWRAYVASAEMPWNLSRVVHLHRRAGFAATWDEIQRDLRDGPEASVTRLLNGTTRINGQISDFEAISSLQGTGGQATNAPDRLKAWWIFRMLFSPDPLGERLTLMWHNHFATSNLKVQDLGSMGRQNELFREFARAPYGELLRRVMKDPALLVWLDAPANRKEHPNENLARETMELFTLGVGNYTESDVKQAARALTGWSVKHDAFYKLPQYHDEGEKTILGRTGNWRGDDFVAMLLEQPAISVRMANRLCELFMGEGGTVPEQLESLAVGLRANNLTIGSAVERILRSEAFFTTKNIRATVGNPAQFVIGTTRALELFDPSPSTLLLSEWIGRMGLELFYPPNVFGWRGGRSWIDSRSLVARTKYVIEQIEGSSNTGHILGLIEQHTQKTDKESGIRFLSEVILGAEPSKELDQELHATVGHAANFDGETTRRVAISLLSSPEAQIF